MLLINVSDQEMLDAKARSNNPDYETIQKQKENVTGIPDMSSVFNAALAANYEAIESLKRELKAKEDVIQSLRDQLSTRDQLIAEQKARLIDYRSLIDTKDLLKNYPFQMGVAEDKRQQKHP